MMGLLIVRKIHEVLPDEKATKDDLLRVVDESGGDYLYHRSQFIFVELPAGKERALRTVQDSAALPRGRRPPVVSLVLFFIACLTPALDLFASFRQHGAKGLDLIERDDDP